MKKHYLMAGFFTFFLALDQITKHIIQKVLKFEGDKIDVLGTFLQFRLTYNRGGVFGILQGKQSAFLIVSIIVFIMLIAFYYVERKNENTSFFISMGLIFSGAIGNIIDRVPLFFGVPNAIEGVVDFISMGIEWPVQFRWATYNIADSAIVVGAALLFRLMLIDLKKERQAKKEEGSK